MPRNEVATLLAEMRAMREAGASYREIGEAFGITERSAHRYLTDPAHRWAERSLIKMRRARQERALASVKTSAARGRATGLTIS